MALTLPTDEERIRELLGTNSRAITFVHAFLCEKPCIDMEGKINFIKNKTFEVVEEVHNLWLENKASLPELENISKNQRLINFIQFIVYKNYNPKTILAENSHIQLLALIDFVLAKDRKANTFATRYSPITLEKNIEQEIKGFLDESKTLTKKTEWVNFKNTEHMQWIINYIDQKLEIRIVDSFIAAPKATDTSNKGMLQYIQYFFDTLPYATNQHYAENFLIKIKRANSQRKYRNENAERVASNYMLRKDIKIKLKEISKKERLNLNETIELLIEQAHAKLKGTS